MTKGASQQTWHNVIKSLKADIDTLIRSHQASMSQAVNIAEDALGYVTSIVASAQAAKNELSVAVGSLDLLKNVYSTGAPEINAERVVAAVDDDSR